MKKNILIADADDLVLNLGRGLYERIGCSVQTAHDSEEALGCLLNVQLSLALIEVELPGLGGFEVLRKIRANPVSAGAPVLLLGESEEPDFRQRCRDAGASDFVHKPFKLVDLIRTTGKLLSVPFRCPLRVPVKIAVPRAAGPQWVEAEARDISNSGLLVASAEQFTVGTPVSLEFLLPGQEEITGTPGLVRRQVNSMEQEYGIAFLDTPEAVLEYIQSFMQGFSDSA